jgi:hypothetical protein
MVKKYLFVILLFSLFMLGCSTSNKNLIMSCTCDDTRSYWTLDNSTIYSMSSYDVLINGTLTYNNFYAEGYYYNSTGGGTPYLIDLVTVNTNYNLTNFMAGEYNGFTFEDNGVTANYGGIYQLTGSITFTGGNDEYAFVMTKNNVPISKCGMGITATLTQRKNVALTCLVELNAGEHLNLQVMDKNTPVTDVNIYKVNLNIIKVSG